MFARPILHALFVLSIALLSLPSWSDGQVVGRTRVGELSVTEFRSAHPYPAGEQVVEIFHPGATYIKVHFSKFNLAPGDRLIISSEDGSEQYVFAGRGYKNKGENFWGNSVLGERAILRLQSLNGGDFGYEIDQYAYGTLPLFPPDETNSVCGANDWQDALCFETSHPTEFDRAKRGVVVLFNGVENCSGVKIGCPNQFLTNEHCVTSQAEVDVTEVRFDFQRSECGGSSSSFSQSYLGDQFVDDDFTLDYCVFTAEGNSIDYEAAEIDPRLPPVGEPIYITHHPSGMPKQISIIDSQSPTGLCQVDISPTNGRGVDSDIGYFCDTIGGSSGSPVWSGVSHKLIGLHHFGGCANGGVRIDLIYDEISGLISSCCEVEPNTPTVVATQVGDNRIDLDWTDSDLVSVTEYEISRARNAGGPYTVIATVADQSMGVADGSPYSYTDLDVSGGITYFYNVSSTDGEQCTSDASADAAATATGACTLAPDFDGLAEVVSPATGICTLQMNWSPAIPECGSSVTYNVYRSPSPDFAPSLSNQVATGLSATAYEDINQLVTGEDYYYRVRAVDALNGAEDQNGIELIGTPIGISGSCTTASSCIENPFVDVLPDGPMTVCIGTAPELSASLSSGSGPFVYQWLQNGVPIEGETSPELAPDNLGTHTYNALVRSESCPDEVFDGIETQILTVDRPFFSGLQSIANGQDGTCSVDLNWQAATTPCTGPIQYFVYRSQTAPVDTAPANLVASGLSGTQLNDSFDLGHDETYHYLVKAYDTSTGQFDSNVVELSATPTGPGHGINSALFAEFTTAVDFSTWTVTTGPGPHNCGAWALSTNGSARPTGSAGNFAATFSECQPLLPLTSTIMESPAIDLTQSNILSVALELDVRYATVNGDDATIDVFDGSQWINLWQDPNGSVNQHLSFNVSSQAIGNPAFRIRFSYQNANADQFFAVDNVNLITDRISLCDTAAAGPVSVRQGSLIVDRELGAPGAPLGISWDVSNCQAADYNLLYGDLANVSSYAVSGSECSLGTTGSHSWSPASVGDLYFIVVGSDGGATESSWGRASSQAERSPVAPSDECGVSQKNATNVCP